MIYLFIISTSFVPVSSVSPVISAVKLNGSVSLEPLNSKTSPLSFAAGISLQYCYKVPNVFE